MWYPTGGYTDSMTSIKTDYDREVFSQNSGRGFSGLLHFTLIDRNYFLLPI